MYNPRGHSDAAEYRFPFRDAEFDFACLTSLFTHMPKREIEHYLAELACTMRPNGRYLVTYFLLNDEARALITAGRSSIDLRYPLDGSWTTMKMFPRPRLASMRNTSGRFTMTAGSH
jgi:SAM-dependent methyltransferase